MKRFLFLMLMSLPVCGFAHEGSGVLGDPEDKANDVGDAAAISDYIMISCKADGSIPADKLYFQLTSNSPADAPFLVSAQIAKDNSATNVTDPINGDVNPSRQVVVNGGEGMYRVTINKNGVGKASYSFVYHCESNEGEHAETTDSSLQNN